MPIEKKELDWGGYFDKEKVYRQIIMDLLEANRDKAYTFLELCAEVYRRIGKDNIKMDTIFEGNVRVALQDPRIAMVLHKKDMYYSLKD